MPKVYIDGTEYEVAPGKNMLQVALDYKLDLPYFCWHAAMGSVGACRQCAIRVFKDESDTKGKIEMACMTPAVDGLRASINDPEAAEFRRYVIEWLMTNHPHDCPVCDEGGECHLQDMTALCGHVYRRFRGRKRTHVNQDLGPFVNHEMNRCIQCYRCVRFYRDLAGGRDFDVLGSRNFVYFGRAADGVLESEFSGNLVEICPTGVFTDKTLKRHYTRKWDLQTAPSVCIHCGLGCNTIPGARGGELRRVHARYNSEVNGYFICDRGRYGYEFVNHDHRVRNCSANANGRRSTIEHDDAIKRASAMLRDAKGIVGIGSPRASLEANYALQKLVGDAFSTGLSAYEHEGAQLALDILRAGPARTPSLAEVESADVIVILGADPTNEAPMLDFAIRQALRKAPLDISRRLKIPDWDANAVSTALQDAKGKLHIAAPWRIKLEALAVDAARLSFSNVARFALDMPAKAMADLQQARQPLIVTSISAGIEVLTSAAELARSLREAGKDCWLSIIVPEANTVGVSLLGGMSAEDALLRVESGEADTLIVLENDLARRVSPARFESAMGKVKNLIVLDCIETATTTAASLVLPAPASVECDGTFVNNEARAQRFFQVFAASWQPMPAWRTISNVTLHPPDVTPPPSNVTPHPPDVILNLIQDPRGSDHWSTYEDVLHDMAQDHPALSAALEAAPPAGWRSPAQQKVARQPHRFSGRTAQDADRIIHEPQPPADPETPFAFSMEGDQNPVPGPLLPRYWWPGWNSTNSVTKFQTEVNGPLHAANPGKRLIEPSGAPDSLPPREGEPKNGVWLLPRTAIFGSEELSRLARGVAELSPLVDIGMHPDLARKLGLVEGELIEFDAGGKIVRLPCRLDDSIAADVATIPANTAETIGIPAPIRLNVARAK